MPPNPDAFSSESSGICKGKGQAIIFSIKVGSTDKLVYMNSVKAETHLSFHYQTGLQQFGFLLDLSH